MKRFIKWGAMIAWMIVIFSFSAQTGEQSSQSSGLIERLLAQFSFMPNQIFGLDIQFMIRKTAHFSEYFILYLLIFNVIKEYQPKKQSLAFSLVGLFLYACSDEIHQAFVPSRACLFTDVLIDTAGGTLAMILVALLKRNKKV